MGRDNVFALGDAANLPTSKAGSVAHYSVDVFVDNFIEHIAGRPMTEQFDGHANCFIESGNGKGLLIDFNYDIEPLPGKFPIPGVGPFSLLEESHANHWGKLGFRWAYWKRPPARSPDAAGTCDVDEGQASARERRLTERSIKKESKTDDYDSDHPRWPTTSTSTTKAL